MARWLFEKKKLDRDAAIAAEAVAQANAAIQSGERDIAACLEQRVRRYRESLPA